jgi:hypothetical protein
MKVLSGLLLATALSLEGVSGTLLRGRNEQVMPPLVESPSAIRTNAMPKATLLTERKLSAGDFSALDCNSGLEEPQACLPWTSAFSNATSHSEEVLIPCGQCYEMDLSDVTLDLTGGLDIQGKLVFPDGYKLTLKAPFIRIQGELHMTSTKIPNGQEDVKFVLTGTNENLTKFTPAGNNVEACNGQCSVGKKPIVVAGGKLVINGLPSADDFPSWVPLHDIATASSAQSLPADEYDSYQAPPVIDGCDSEGKYIFQDFSTPAFSNFMPSLGSNVTYTDDSCLLMDNRKSSRHFLYVDLKGIRHCLQESRTYLLTARVKLMRQGATLTEVRQTDFV